MNKVSFTRKLSLIAGGVSIVTAGYVGLSLIWGFPYAYEVFQTGGVITVMISGALGVYTGTKLDSKYTQEGIKEFGDNTDPWSTKKTPSPFQRV